MSDWRQFTVDEAEAGQRLDAVVARRYSDLSRSAVHAMAQGGDIVVDGRTEKGSARLKSDQLVALQLPSRVSRAFAQDLPLTIVYQDNDLAVIDKPPGLVVHPAAGHADGTLANALAAIFPQITGVGAENRPGIVHRLDKDTSGLLVVALNPQAHASLQQQIASRQAGRRYLALASGRIVPDTGVIEAPIGRDPRNRLRMSAYGLGARPAATEYAVLEYMPGFSYLEARLQTGRTHQIRVHFAATGHALAGDGTYGGPEVEGLERQFLHAWRLIVQSPTSGESLDFQSPLPRDLAAVLTELRNKE